MTDWSPGTHNIRSERRPTLNTSLQLLHLRTEALKSLWNGMEYFQVRRVDSCGQELYPTFELKWLVSITFKHYSFRNTMYEKDKWNTKFRCLLTLLSLLMRDLVPFSIVMFLYFSCHTINILKLAGNYLVPPRWQYSVSTSKKGNILYWFLVVNSHSSISPRVSQSLSVIDSLG